MRSRLLLLLLGLAVAATIQDGLSMARWGPKSVMTS